MASICDSCSAPGACCKTIRVSNRLNVTTALEALAIMASCQPASGELGLPFIPRERTRSYLNGEFSISPVVEEWTYDCIHLTSEGRCGNYEFRPKLCRVFEAGVDKPCVMRPESEG